MPEIARIKAAGLISTCPGRETSPNECRCPCQGCKYNCGAHNPTDAQ